MLRTIFGTIDLTADQPYKDVPKAYLPEPIAPERKQLTYVQFEDRIRSKHREMVKAQGAELRGYLPDNTLLVEADGKSIAALRKRPEVRAVVPQAPYFKLGPYVRRAMEQVDTEQEVEIVVAGFLPNYIPQANLAAAGYPVDRSAGRGVHPHLKATAEQLNGFLPTLAARSDVAWVDVYFRPRPVSPANSGTASSSAIVMNDQSASVLQGGSNDPIATPIWDQGITGTGQIVCVTDSGCDADHEMFYDEVLQTVIVPSTYASPALEPAQRKIIGYFDMNDFTNDYDYDPYDGVFHGTHVSGTVAGYFNPATGDNTYKGVAYDAKLAINDIGTPFGYLIYDNGGIQGLIGNTVFAGAYINTNSWGATPGDFADYYNTDAQQFDFYVEANPDVLVLFAAGNSGIQPGGSLGFQGNAKNIVVVGATGDGGNQSDPENNLSDNDIRAEFSSNGPTGDGRYRPHIMAPGNYVWSAAGDSVTTNARADNNQDVKSLRGTSMATPGAAGAAALIRQYFVDGFYPTGAQVGGNSHAPSAALLKAMLLNSGYDMVGNSDGSGGTMTNVPNNRQGWGRVLLDNVLFFTGEEKELYIDDSGSVSDAAPVHDRFVTVDDGNVPLRITVVWTDYPALVDASPALVSDLNLYVVGPDGKVYVGNNFSGGETPGSSTTLGQSTVVPDALNNEESVYINSPAAGAYRIRVQAANLPSGPQDFALVVTGGMGEEPEIVVAGSPDGVNEVEIVTPHTSPATIDGTDFGGVGVDTPATHTFSISNAGRNPLTVNSISLSGSADFGLSTPELPPFTVAANSSKEFDVTFTPSAAATVTADITISNDDSDEGTYEFRVSGTGGYPEIDITGNGNAIPDDDALTTTPSVTNNTDFGSVGVGDSSTEAYVIQNTGNAQLALTGASLVAIGGTNPGDFTVSTEPAATVASGGNTSFEITFTPSADGLRQATVTIENDDTDEDPYTFNIQGTGGVPEMVVSGNSQTIANPDYTPSINDHTEFGDTGLSAETVRTFTITNSGDATLNLTGTPAVAIGGSHPDDFTVTADPAVSVAAGANTTFQITFTPADTGLRQATVTIVSDDPDDNPYVFAIQGSGTDGTTTGGGSGGSDDDLIYYDSGSSSGCRMGRAYAGEEALGAYLPLLLAVLCLPMSILYLRRRSL